MPSDLSQQFSVGNRGTPIPVGSYYIPFGTPKANLTLADTWTWFSIGDSYYNDLQLDLNHPFSHGLSYRAVYTWSKATDDGDSLNATTAGNAPGLVPGLVVNPYDVRADWGLATYDVRQIAVISIVYDLPFGRGQTFANCLANTLVSGRQANSIVTLQAGFPFTPQLSYNPSNNGDTRNPVRPYANPNFNVITGNPGQWFNPAAFLQPPPDSGFYGNLGRDNLIGPGFAT
jgi:hypothetical protein